MPQCVGVRLGLGLERLARGHLGGPFALASASKQIPSDVAHQHQDAKEGRKVVNNHLFIHAFIVLALPGQMNLSRHICPIHTRTVCVV
jgi:hypothetical protein